MKEPLIMKLMVLLLCVALSYLLWKFWAFPCAEACKPVNAWLGFLLPFFLPLTLCKIVFVSLNGKQKRTSTLMVWIAVFLVFTACAIYISVDDPIDYYYGKEAG